MHTKSKRALSSAVFSAALCAANAANAQVEAMPADLRVAPIAGRRAATAQAGVPGYCAGATARPLRPNQLRATYLRTVMGLQHAATRTNSLELERATGFMAVAQLACAHGTDPNLRDWMQSWRQVMINATDLDDASLDQVLRAALSQTGRSFEVSCGTFAGQSAVRREGGEGGAVGGRALRHEAMRADMLRSLACERAPLFEVDELAYWFDRGGGAREEFPTLLRAGLVQTALRLGPAVIGRAWDERGTTVEQRGRDLLAWLFVRDDVGAIDLAAARQELARSGIPAESQAMALVRVARIKLLAKAVGEAWRAVAAREPALAPMLESIPNRARDEYRREAQENRAGLDRAWAVEDAFLQQNTSAMQGCSAPLLSAFTQYAQRVGARDERSVRALFDRPVGHVLGAAIFRCELAAGTPGHAWAFADMIKSSPIQRGERMAALQAVVRAVRQEVESNPRFPLDAGRLYLEAGARGGGDWIGDANSMSASTSAGVVASMRPQGDRVLLTFQQRRAIVPTFACTRSNRISRICRDGSVEYERDCVVNGQVEVDATSEPVAIPASMVGPIAVGTTVRAIRTLQRPEGFAIEVLSSARTQLAFMGVAFEGAQSAAASSAAAPARPRRR